MPRGGRRLGGAELVQILLDGAVPEDLGAEADWRSIEKTAEKNGTLVRLADRLACAGIRPPNSFTGAVARARSRNAAALELILTIGDRCEARGIPFLFPKAVLHWPDMTDDLDLLVLSQSANVDREITSGLRATASARTIDRCIAGTSGYTVEGCLPLDIQHGRLGAVGEQVEFTGELLRHRHAVAVDGMSLFTASDDDQLVLQGMQRLYGRLGIQACDVVATIIAVRRDLVDWDYIIRVARHLGVFPGLSCYLGYVDQIHREVYNESLPVRMPPSAPWGRLRFRKGLFRYPVLRVNSRLYARAFGAQIAAGNWSGAGRLCLLPVVGLARASRWLNRRRNSERAR